MSCCGGEGVQYQEQYQLGIAKINYVYGPNSAPAGAQIVFDVDVLNTDSVAGTLFVTLVRMTDSFAVDQKAAILQPTQDYIFVLSTFMPTAPTYYLIQVGHARVGIGGLTEYVVDDQQQVYITIPGMIEGKIPPIGATQVVVFDVFFPVIIAGAETKIASDLAGQWAIIQGLTVLRVDAIPDRNKILVWISTPAGQPFPPPVIGVLPVFPAWVSAINVKDPRFQALIVIAIIVLVGYFVVVNSHQILDIQSNIVYTFQLWGAAMITAMANQGLGMILNSNLTPQQKADATAEYFKYVDQVSKRPPQTFPWTTLAVAGVAGLALTGGIIMLARGNKSGGVNFFLPSRLSASKTEVH